MILNCHLSELTLLPMVVYLESATCEPLCSAELAYFVHVPVKHPNKVRFCKTCAYDSSCSGVANL